jgi:hypothetical protein
MSSCPAEHSSGPEDTAISRIIRLPERGGQYLSGRRISIELDHSRAVIAAAIRLSSGRNGSRVGKCYLSMLTTIADKVRDRLVVLNNGAEQGR